MHVWLDTGGYHTEAVRNASRAKSLAMCVIQTQGGVFVPCLLRGLLASDVRLVHGTMIRIKDVENVSVTKKDLLEGNVM